MTYRRTWFDYIAWTAFTGVCVMLLTFMGFFLLGSEENAYHVISALLAFPLVIICYLAVKAAAHAVRRRYTMRAHTASMWEWFIAMLVFVMSFLTAWHYIGTNQPLSDLYDTTYFDMAAVGKGTVMPTTHGAGYLYVLCLSFVLSFLGNRLIAAVMFQLFLYMISLILCYVIVRKMAGRFPACVALCLLYVLDTGRAALGAVDPGCFIFVLYLIGMLVTVSFVKSYCKGGITKPAAFMGAAVTGLIIGILVYFDLTAVTLFLFLGGILVGKQSDAQDKERTTTGFRAAAFLTALLGGAAAWFVMLFVVSAGGGVSVWQGIKGWEELHIVNAGHYQLFRFLSETNLSTECLLSGFGMVFPAAFLVFSFLGNEKEQNYMLWVVACLAIAPTPFCGNGVVMYRGVPVFFWAVLAALGLQNCIFGDKFKVVQAVMEELHAAAQTEPQTAAAVSAEAQTIGAAPPSPAVEPTQQETPRFIENPLPLPKKHVKKEMEYQYEVEESRMYYDIEVDDDDDFDL